jgi:hypothetical protein
MGRILILIPQKPAPKSPVFGLTLRCFCFKDSGLSPKIVYLVGELTLPDLEAIYGARE